jgi:hypothetical protein
MAATFSPVVAMLRLVLILLPLLFIALHAYLLYYVEQLRRTGCKCADGWQRKVIEASLIFFIVSFVVGFFVQGMPAVCLVVLNQVVALTYIVVARWFIEKMRETHCACAETRAFDVLNWWNAVQITCIMLAVVITVIALFSARPAGAGLANGSRRR